MYVVFVPAISAVHHWCTKPLIYLIGSISKVSLSCSVGFRPFMLYFVHLKWVFYIFNDNKISYKVHHNVSFMMM